MSARMKLYNVLAQRVCTRKGWTSSVGLPGVFEVRATTKTGAIRQAMRQWRKAGKLPKRGAGRGCKLHPSAEEI